MSKIKRGSFTIQGIKYIVVEREELEHLEAERDKRKSEDEYYNNMTQLVGEQKQQLQKLKEYVTHKPDCDVQLMSDECTCGLDELLNQGD